MAASLVAQRNLATAVRMVDLRCGFAAGRLLRCAASRPSSTVQAPAFFTLLPFKTGGVVLADKGPDKYFMRLHHPLLPGEEPSPSDQLVYRPKLRIGAPVLASGDSLSTVGWGKSRTLDDKVKSWLNSPDTDLMLSYATSWDMIYGTLQGPGSAPNTYRVLQDGAAGESFTVHADGLQVGSRERIILGSRMSLKDLEWEVRMMWPTILDKVRFEVGGEIQDSGAIATNTIRAGQLVVRLVEGRQEPIVGQPVFVTTDPDHYEEACKESGLSWPYTERGGPRLQRMGQHGSVTKVDLSNNTVELSNNIRWVPIRSLIGFERFSGQVGDTRPEVSVPCRADPSYSPTLFSRLFGG